MNDGGRCTVGEIDTGAPGDLLHLVPSAAQFVSGVQIVQQAGQWRWRGHQFVPPAPVSSLDSAVSGQGFSSTTNL